MTKKSGFTLVEVVVVMGLAAMIFMVVSGLMVSFLNAGGKSRQQQALEQARDDIVTEISNAVRWGEGEVIVGQNKLEAGRAVYELSGDRLVKDGVALTSAEVVVESLETRDYSGVAEFPSLEIKISMRSRSLPQIRDDLRLVVSKRKTEVESQL